ncbi:hypothetical protein QM012_007513 [Aureobasidium pullulans]|uniref:Amidoligase enzyme n=1 Tax=Aureobasidium pullulans TaxID=5580 RepID=A0ABR0TPQ7_AURPU
MSFAAVDIAAGQPSIMENMTFGIEFEFLCYTPRNKGPRSHLSQALKKPVVLPCTRCGQNHSWMLPTEGVLDYFVAPFTTWTLHRDTTVKPSDDEKAHVPEGSVFYNMELVSRTLNFSKSTPDPIGQRYPCNGELFEWDSYTEISTFMGRVHEAFSDDGFCCSNNKSTGLHIHFGNGKYQPPIKSSLGMFGVFAALERQFDQISPASRIPALSFDGPTPGIPGSVPEYKRQVSDWVGAGSRAFLESMRLAIKTAIKDDPELNRSTITEELQNCNVPAWLDTILKFEQVETFFSAWPKDDSTGEVLGRRSMAINLQNLTSSVGKSTVEVRAAPGSLDFSEIWAWLQFMGKLMLWLATPGIDHIAIITKIWADPNSTVVDLLKKIGASQTIIHFYTDRLSADWAERQHARLTSTIKADDPFKSFLTAIENNRLADYRRVTVDTKILQKLEGGYYGQITNALFKTLPAKIQNRAADAAVIVVQPPSPNTSWSDDPFNLSNPFARKTPGMFSAASPDFNRPRPLDLDDPFTTLPAPPTPSRTSKHPKTVNGATANLPDHDTKNLSDASEECPFRNTDDKKRTFAISAPPGGFPDTRPKSPDSDGDDVDFSYYGL